MRTVHLCGEELTHPGHVCAFFDSREQKYATLVPFLKDAISAGDEVINIVDASEKAQHLDKLVEGGVPVRAAMENGALSVFTSEETYLEPGPDTLPRLLAFLRDTHARARSENHSLRTWGEMNWVERDQVPLADVLEYEARVNELLPDSSAHCSACTTPPAYRPHSSRIFWLPILSPSSTVGCAGTPTTSSRTPFLTCCALAGRGRLPLHIYSDAVHGVRRGTQRPTFLLYSSYDSPNSRSR